MRHLRSALSTATVAAIATVGVLLLSPALAQSATPTFVQGTAFSTARLSTITVTLSRPVAQGDLLVGWIAQYNVPEEIQMADNVNGTWTRAPAALTFTDDTGDIALYYRENSQAAPAGLTITLSVSSPAYWQGAVADYSGVALAGALDQIVSKRFSDGTSVDTGPTPPVGAGELVYAGVITSPSAGSVTPGSSQGVRYTARAQASSAASFEEDITSSAAGAQDGTATLSSTTDWYAVCAVFHPYPATPPVPPSTPTGLAATSVASTRVTLSWSASASGSVAGYAVYRDGALIGTTRPDSTVFVDQDAAASTTYTYTVDAFDLANDHSAPSAPLMITTPAVSPEFVQGAADSTGSSVSSRSLTFTEPVQAGDLLVGWFGQAGASGQVRVSDNVNGSWTRSVSTTWGGSGDIALYYRQNSAAAPSGLTITVVPPASAYLQEAVAHYRHVGTLDQAVVADGQGTYASTSPSAPVPAGELVVAAVLTSGQPVFATPGSSQTVPYVLDVKYGSASADVEDILSCAAGPQQGSLTFGATDSWHMVLATFRPAGGSTTTSTTSPTSTTTSSTTTSTTTTPRPTTTTTTTSTSTTTTTTTFPGTTTSLTSSVHPSVFGQPVTFTATVTANSPAAGTPTGTVTFKDGPSTLGTGTLNGSGQTTFTTSALAVGSHSITAAYGGDANFAGSTSSKLTQTVKKAR